MNHNRGDVDNPVPVLAGNGKLFLLEPQKETLC